MSLAAFLAPDAAASTPPPHPAVTPASTTSPVPLLSTYEADGVHTIAGDVGQAVALPNGRELLLRGDSPYYRYNPRDTDGLQLLHFISGSSAAEGPYAPGTVPQSLAEVPSPPAPFTGAAGTPRLFLPNPRDTRVPNSSRSCNKPGPHFPVAWITGAALDPASYSSTLGYDTDVLITYSETCVLRLFTDGFVEGWGFAEYNWANNTFDANVEVYHPRPFALLPIAAALGSPVFANGQVYLFSSVCDRAAPGGGCGSGRVFGATVADNLTAMRDPTQYFYFDPSVAGGQTNDPATASAQSGSLLGGANPGVFGIAVADYAGVAGYPGPGLELVDMTNLSGGYQVWQSAGPFGTWFLETSGSLPGCTARDLKGFTIVCHALVGHPELSTGAGMMLSYMESLTLHLEALLVPW